MKLLGIYNLWDDKSFTEHTAEDLMWFFKVNVVVSYDYLRNDLPSRLFYGIIKEDLPSLETIGTA
jgi:hypothetical protein